MNPLLPLAAFATVLLGVGAMRLVELVVSVRRIATRPDDAVSEPRLFPAMALLHAGLVFGPLAEVWLLQRAFDPEVCAVAVTVLVAATALRIWTLRTIGASWNVRVVAPEVVVTTGPYRHIRHPNYLCVIIELAALPLLHSAWISAVVLSGINAAVLLVRIRTEEATLMQNEAWRSAFADTPRLLPRFRTFQTKHGPR